MEVRQFRHVLSLVENASFRKASEVLRISQPALTKSLFQIERELGQRLFDRHGKSVVPTVFGEIVARTARIVLDAHDDMSRSIGQVADLTTGTLSVGSGPYVADVWMGQVAGRLLRQYPQLHLTLHVEHWDSLPDLLRRGRVDLFVASIEHIRNHKDFRIVEMPEQRGIWVCRAGHPLNRRKSPRRSAIGDYPMISPQLPDPIRRWLDDEYPRPIRARRQIDSTSVSMIKAMVRHGDAVTVVHPDTVRSELASGEFVELKFDAPPVTFHAGLVWLADRSLSPAGIAFARELFAEVGLDAGSSFC